MGFSGVNEQPVITIKVKADTTEAKNGIISLSESLKKQNDAFGEMGKAVREMWDTLTEGARQYLALSAAGDRYGDVMKALKVDISAATEALHGQVGEMDLAMAANTAMQMGLKLTSDQFADIAKVAKAYADATGGDAASATQQLAAAMATGRERALRPFGIHAGTVTERMIELAKKASEVNVEIGGVTDASDALSERWDTLMLKMGESMDENGPLTKVITGVADLVGWFNRSPAAVEGLGSAITMLTLGPLPELLRKLEAIAGARARAGLQSDDWINQISAGTWDEAANARAAHPEDFNRELADGRSSNHGGRMGALDRPPPPRGGGGGGGGRRDPRLGMMDSALASMSSTGELQDTRGQNFIGSAFGIPSEEQQDALLEGLTTFGERKFDVLEEARRHEHDATLEHEHEMAAIRMEAANQELELAKKRQQAAIATTTGILGAAAQLAAGLGAPKAWGMVLTGLEEEVLAAASLAGQDYIGATLHEAAAVLAFVNAAKASSGSGGGGGGGGGGFRTGSRRPAGTLPPGGLFSSPTGQAGGGGTVIYNVMIDTAGTGYIPDDVTLRFHQMQRLAADRHGYPEDPRMS